MNLLKRILLLNLLLLAYIYNFSFAQEEKPVKKQSTKSIEKYNYNQQFLLYGGVNIPVGSYANVPGNAKLGPLVGLGFDNYFKQGSWGIGLDLRYFSNNADVDQTQELPRSGITTTFNNKPNFQNVALTVGPTFRMVKGKFDFEAYAKFGALFEWFPNYTTNGIYFEDQPFHISNSSNTKDRAIAGAALAGARFNYKVHKLIYLFLQTDYLMGLGNDNSKFNFHEDYEKTAEIPEGTTLEYISITSEFFKPANNNFTTSIKAFNVAAGIKYIIPYVAKPIQPKFILIGKTITKGTDAPASNVKTTLTKNKGKKKTSSSDKNGEFSYTLEPNADYTIVGTKDGFPSNTEKISTKGLTKDKTFYVKLELSIKSLEVGSVMELKNIYYDLNKANIRSDASVVLDNLVRALKENPTIKIELSSHTDSRASDEYNMDLSQRRADAAVNYLISQGIDEKRLVAKGYGESKLINKCANDVECTEEEHQKNRRTEIKILSK
ncbi:MAG: OmpA family protein [Daejeonella sp.]